MSQSASYKTPINSTNDIGPNTTGPGNGPRPTRQGTEHRASNKGGPRGAMNAASPGDTVVIDGTFSDGTLVVKPNIVIVPGSNGGRINFTGGGYAVDVANASGSWIDGITFDGQRNTNFVIAGRGDHGLSNFHVTNCEIANSTFNGIEIAPDKSHTVTKRCSNLFFQGNEIHHCDGHGFFIGPAHATSGTASYVNVIEERNHLHTVCGQNGKQALALTLYGSDRTKTRNSAIIENYVTDCGWSPLGLEEGVEDTLVERNHIKGAYRSGIGATGGTNNIRFAGNIIRNGHNGLLAQGVYGHVGDPNNNLYIDNFIDGVQNAGIDMREAGPNNEFRNNHFRNYGSRISDKGAAGGQVFEGNDWNAPAGVVVGKGSLAHSLEIDALGGPVSYEVEVSGYISKSN